MLKNEQLDQIYSLAAAGRFWATSPTKRSELIRSIGLETEIAEDAIEKFLNRETYSRYWDKKIGSEGEIHYQQGVTYFEAGQEAIYLITSAQNNTDIHGPFLANLKAYANYLEAQLLVTTFTYKKSGFAQVLRDSNGVWFNSELADYIAQPQRIKLAPDLTLAADLNVSPSADYPLSGLDRYCRGSMILGHAKMQLEPVAVMKGQRAKHLYTTGCVTLRNYLQKKAGQKAERWHTYGALIVTVKADGRWFVRQLQAEPDTGAFYDLFHRVENGEVMEAQGHIAAINWGDHHAEKQDKKILDICYDMIYALQPTINVMHDICDFSPRNHHNIKDPHWMFEQWSNGTESVKDAGAAVGELLSEFRPALVVESNHDLAVDRWLKEGSFKSDPVNAITYLTLTLNKYKAITAGKNHNVLVDLLDLAGYNFTPDDVTYLQIDDSYRICEGSALYPDGIELGLHGHNGANGAKGSPKGFQKLDLALNTGHTHSASIYGDVWTAGVTGSLEMGYNVGASSWSHSHIVTYDNGARTMVTFWPTGDKMRIEESWR